MVCSFSQSSHNIWCCFAAEGGSVLYPSFISCGGKHRSHNRAFLSKKLVKLPRMYASCGTYMHSAVCRGVKTLEQSRRNENLFPEPSWIINARFCPVRRERERRRVVGLFWLLRGGRETNLGRGRVNSKKETENSCSGSGTREAAGWRRQPFV